MTTEQGSPFGSSAQANDEQFAKRLALLRPNTRRELVFGFVSPIGADRNTVLRLFSQGLEQADYVAQTVEVSSLLEEYVASSLLSEHLSRKKTLMDVGDQMREQWDKAADSKRGLKGEAVGLRALVDIRSRRTELLKSINQAEGIVDNAAFIIDSLKHPDELDLLRTVYGPAFYAIGLYSPKKQRQRDLVIDAEAETQSGFAEKLIERDLHDTSDFGQHVEDAFHECDFILRVTDDEDAVLHEINRFVRLVFGDPQYTPTREEVGMFLARASQARSGSLARQVGSAILRQDGSVVAVGTNEVPRPISGGQYWAEDGALGSDLRYARRDTSDRYREEAIVDILDILSRLPGGFEKRIKVDKALLADSESLRRLLTGKDAPLGKALIRDSIDRIRAVHAEAAAIMDSARNGVSTKKSTMYVTTFPCHECARHIVAAGIREVIYLAPYPKSAVREMYRDSIKLDASKPSKKKVTFRSFVGVTPRRYLQFFSVGKRSRKQDDGTPTQRNIKEEPPYLPGDSSPPGLAILNESRVLGQFIPFLQKQFKFDPQETPGGVEQNGANAGGTQPPA
jgi:cytidine deaminase